MDRVTDRNALHWPMEDEKTTRFAQWKSSLAAGSHVLVKVVGNTISASWSVTNTGGVSAFGALDMVFTPVGTPFSPASVGFFGALTSIPGGATVTLSVSGVITSLLPGTTYNAEVRVKAASPATVAPGGVHPFTLTISGSSGPVPVTIALAELIATGHLLYVSSFNSATGLFESFVPGLGGSLTEIRPNSTLTIRMSQTHTILSSGISYLIPADTPTQVLVGAEVNIMVL